MFNFPGIQMASQAPCPVIFFSVFGKTTISMWSDTVLSVLCSRKSMQFDSHSQPLYQDAKCIAENGYGDIIVSEFKKKKNQPLVSID